MEELRMSKPVATEKKTGLIEVPAGTVMGGYRVKTALIVKLHYEPGEDVVSIIKWGPFTWAGQGATDREAVEDVVTGIGDSKQSMERFSLTHGLGKDSLYEMGEMGKVIERIAE